MLHVPGLYILDSDERGRGVYCSHDLELNDIIEACPIIKIPVGQLNQLNPTIIYEYYFLWEEAGYEAAIALGYGSLYNHSYTPNAEIILDYDANQIIIQAVDNIAAGSEILIDYNGGVEGAKKLWFDVY